MQIQRWIDLNCFRLLQNVSLSLTCLFLLLLSGCVHNSSRGTMYSWRIGFNEHQRPAVICEHIEARPPRRERVNYYRYQHAELLADATPVSYSELTPDIPAKQSTPAPQYQDPFQNNPAVNSQTSDPDCQNAPAPQFPAQTPVNPMLPPPVWNHPEDNSNTPDNSSTVPSTDDSSAPEIMKSESGDHIAKSPFKSLYHQVNFSKAFSGR